MGIVPPGKCWLLFSSPKKSSIYRMGKQLFSHWLLSHGNYISRGKYLMSNSGCEQLCAPRQLLGCASVGMGSWCILHFLQTYLNWKTRSLIKKKSTSADKQNTEFSDNEKLLYFIISLFCMEAKSWCVNILKKTWKISSRFWSMSF